MKIKNLTPHTLNVFDVAGNEHTIPSDGVARAEETRIKLTQIGDFAVDTVMYGNAIGLPELEEGTIIVVSALTAQSPECKSRQDVYIPGPLLRDENGKIVGCVGLSKI